MFFRRGRLSEKKARALLIELFDQRYQWPLRMPLTYVLGRGDPLRFLCSLRFVVDQIGTGLYLLNRRQPPEQTPWFDGDLSTAVADLPLQPQGLVARLDGVMRLADPAEAELQARRLLLDIITLTPKEKKRHQDQETPVVSWLPRIAPLELATVPAPRDESPDLLRLAQRAVRIVWRLPGSRFAALTGSVAAGYADLSSDVDITLFGLKLADASVRRSLIAATSDAPNDITQWTTPTHAADAFWLQNRLVDVRYFLIDEARRLIADPVPQSRTDQELLARLSTADILVDYEMRGPDLLRDLEAATRKSRDARIARSTAALDQALARLQTRIDSVGIFGATVDAVLALFQLLAAHNDRWIVFPKWTAAWLDSLAHVPAETHRRLADIALLPSDPQHVPAKLETLRSLAAELGRASG